MSNTPVHKLVIATRGSKLALWQSHHIRDRLLADGPRTGITEVELMVIKTRGDKILDRALSAVGGKGLFVKELEEALLDGRADLAVHSMKDVPSELPDGLTIGAVPARANPYDALVFSKSVHGPSDLGDLPNGAVVGTSSLRRAAQVLALHPHLKIVPVRGNLDTRLRKLDEGVDGMQALILACAGLERMGWQDRISRALAPDEMVPAVAQGALGIEIRTADPKVAPIIALLDDPKTRSCVVAERAFLRRLEGNCQVPLGAYAQRMDDTLSMVGFVGSPDGKATYRDEMRRPVHEATDLGEGLADALLEAGGRAVLAQLAEA